MESPFESFIGKEIKSTYRDGTQFKIARGKLESVTKGFLRVRGRLGTIVINENAIEKLSLLKSG